MGWCRKHRTASRHRDRYEVEPEVSKGVVTGTKFGTQVTEVNRLRQELQAKAKETDVRNTGTKEDIITRILAATQETETANPANLDTERTRTKR